MSAGLAPRILKFLGKPWHEKKVTLSFVATRVWTARPHLPQVRRIDPGFYFVIWNDAVRDSVGSGDFERAERKFVETFLQPGMTVLDVGSYFGIYALTASVTVAKTGRVIAFEPSPPQRNKLRWHLMLNACRNVRVEDIALSCSEGEGELFVPSKGAEGLSSLRSPEVASPVRPVRVKLMRLDTYVSVRRLHLDERFEFL
jgi:FkbM family methyltransferase